MINLVYLIGNGFDINLGLNTSYDNFYKYYNNVVNDNKLIIDVKNSINEYVKNVQIDREHNEKEINWADLELALGEYTERFHAKREFDIVFRDIAQELSNYLQNEEQLYNITQEGKDSIKNYFRNPFNEMLSEFDEFTLLNNFKRLNEIWNIDIISYNYTTVLDKLLDLKKSRLNIGQHFEGNNVYIDRLIHIHGYTDNRMVMGVNDETQIKNKTLLTNQYFRNSIIKNECNAAQGTMHTQNCIDSVRNADAFFMFGLSIGETDKDWWNRVAEAMYANNAPLIIYAYSKRKVSGIFSFDRQEIIDEFKNLFLSKLTIDDAKKQKIKDKIFVAINSNMFKIKLSKQKLAS